MLLFLLACTPEVEDHGPDLAGTVTADDGSSADVVATMAYAASNGSAARVLITANPDTSCADAAAYYGTDADFNGADVGLAGHCVMDIYATKYDGAGTYDGSADVTIGLTCFMDDGTWVWEERTGDEAWYYDGPTWTGSPQGILDYTLELGEATEGSPLELTLGIVDFDGRYPYDNDEPEADPATGEVSGWASAEWCSSMDAAL